MFEVTSRLPVAESIDKSYATTLDLMKTYPQMKGVIGFPVRWGRLAPGRRYRKNGQKTNWRWWGLPCRAGGCAVSDARRYQKSTAVGIRVTPGLHW